MVGAIIAFIPAYLVQHAEVLWVGGTGYGVLMDTILMVVDLLNMFANFLGPGDLIFMSVVIGMFANEFINLYDISKSGIGNVEAFGASKLPYSVDLEIREPMMRQSASLELNLN